MPEPSKESLEQVAKRIVESANREICRANAPSLTAWPPFHDEVYVRIIVAELRQQNAALKHQVGILRTTCDCHISTIEQMEQQEAALVSALRDSATALDDWLNVHASDFCDEQRVREARQRINEFGTIGYIAKIQENNRIALAPYAPAEEAQDKQTGGK